MVRNFGILKIRLFFPTLSDQYSAGPLDVSFTSAETISIGMPKTIRRINAAVKSSSRFISHVRSHQTATGRDRLEDASPGDL